MERVVGTVFLSNWRRQCRWYSFLYYIPQCQQGLHEEALKMDELNVYSHPSVSAGNWFQDTTTTHLLPCPCRCQHWKMLKSLIKTNKSTVGLRTHRCRTQGYGGPTVLIWEQKNCRWRWLTHVCFRDGGSASIKGMQWEQVNIILIYLRYFSLADSIRWYNHQLPYIQTIWFRRYQEFAGKCCF